MISKESFSAEETMELAASMARRLPAGSIVCLEGDLGTGKTAFAKGFALGLDILDDITSPTFTIMHSYSGRLSLYHFDVYRLEDSSELEEIGYEEYFFGEGICLIEWAGIVRDVIPADAIWVKLEKDMQKGTEYRRIRISASGDLFCDKEGTEL